MDIHAEIVASLPRGPFNDPGKLSTAEIDLLARIISITVSGAYSHGYAVGEWIQGKADTATHDAKVEWQERSDEQIRTMWGTFYRVVYDLPVCLKCGNGNHIREECPL